MICDETLPYGFEDDRRYFIDGLEWLQTWIPILDCLTVHPAMLFLLWQNTTMGLDLRLGYLAKLITLILFDAFFNFSFRWYAGLPHPTTYCGGPLCQILGVQSIHFVMAFIINTNTTAFMFLLVRMHNQALFGAESILRASDRTQFWLFSALGVLNAVNIIGFTYYGREADNASEIGNVCELQWMADRGGRLIVYGEIGDPQYFKYGLAFLGATLLLIGPIVVALTLNSVKKLWDNRVAAVSDRTLKMVEKLVKVFIIQLIGAMIFMLLPLTAIFSSFIFDLHDMSGRAMTVARVVVNVAFVLDPLHFPLIFILKTGGHRTIYTCLSRRLRTIRGKSSGCDSGVHNKRPHSGGSITMMTVMKKP